MIDPLTTPRLSELFASRQFVRNAYISISTRRDEEPYDKRLVSAAHLLFSALQLLDSTLDDEYATIHTARGAVQRSNELIKEIGEIMLKGVEA
jgi:hypothetical protein